MPSDSAGPQKHFNAGAAGSNWATGTPWSCALATVSSSGAALSSGTSRKPANRSGVVALSLPASLTTSPPIEPPTRSTNSPVFFVSRMELSRGIVTRTTQSAAAIGWRVFCLTAAAVSTMVGSYRSLAVVITDQSASS